MLPLMKKINIVNYVGIYKESVRYEIQDSRPEKVRVFLTGIGTKTTEYTDVPRNHTVTNIIYPP